MSESSVRLMALIASLVDETIGEDDLRELNELLDGNPNNQLLYKRYLDLHCQLDWNLNATDDVAALAKTRASLATKRTPASATTMRRSRRWIAAAVGACGLALVLLVLLLSNGTGDLSVEAALGDLNGEVVVKRAGGQTPLVSRGMDIQAGDSIETRGDTSFATLEFSDQSRFVLVSNSSATLDKNNLKNLVFRRGRLIASVGSRSATKPFVVAAPHANVRVLGTIAMESRQKQTNLSVLQGLVGVTTKTAGDPVEVSQGEYLVAYEGRPFEVEEAAPNQGGWSEDFEDGLPEHWRGGIFESKGLPRKSKGGVRVAKNQVNGQVFYQINSQEEWARGLFAYRDDLHLHITFKMDHSSWANIFFIARASDAKTHKTFLHKFTIPFGPGSDGVWWKMTVPLSKFQLKTINGFEDIPPTNDELVFGMLFSSPAPDRGLVIDEVAVERGGPGKFVYERLE